MSYGLIGFVCVIVVLIVVGKRLKNVQKYYPTVEEYALQQAIDAGASMQQTALQAQFEDAVNWLMQGGKVNIVGTEAHMFVTLSASLRCDAFVASSFLSSRSKVDGLGTVVRYENVSNKNRRKK